MSLSKYIVSISAFAVANNITPAHGHWRLSWPQSFRGRLTSVTVPIPLRVLESMLSRWWRLSFGGLSQSLLVADAHWSDNQSVNKECYVTYPVGNYLKY